MFKSRTNPPLIIIRIRQSCEHFWDIHWTEKIDSSYLMLNITTNYYQAILFTLGIINRHSKFFYTTCKICIRKSIPFCVSLYIINFQKRLLLLSQKNTPSSFTVSKLKNDHQIDRFIKFFFRYADNNLRMYLLYIYAHQLKHLPKNITCIYISNDDVEQISNIQKPTVYQFAMIFSIFAPNMYVECKQH